MSMAMLSLLYEHDHVESPCMCITILSLIYEAGVVEPPV